MSRLSILLALSFMVGVSIPAHAITTTGSTFVKVETVAVAMPTAAVKQQPASTVELRNSWQRPTPNQVCPKCGKVHGAAQTPQRSVDQSHAQREANLQASRGRMGHLLGCSPNARFSGVGMSSNPNNVPTCTPRGRMTLIGDATARGRNGMYYRSRHWR